MLNQVSIIGNLGADPEIRSTRDGKKIGNLRVAVTEKWKDSQGERKERTEWITVVIFNDGLSGVAERYLRKGSKVFVQGKLATRKWQDQQGNDRYATEVVLNGYDAKLVMLDGAQGNGRRDDGLTHQNQDGFNRDQRPAGGAPQFDDLDDDVPFLRADPVDNLKRRVI